MWFLKRRLKISWIEKISKEILVMKKQRRKLRQAIRKRQFKFCGHIKRENDMENLLNKRKGE